MSSARVRTAWALGTSLSCALHAGLARGDQYVSDPLVAADFPGRGSKGGSFGGDGWTTTNAPTDSSQDAIWYEIADALPTGAFQVTVTGLSVGGTLSGSDHDLLVIYQAPTDQPEPVVYSPYFRNNDFKAFTRIFGTQEIDRPGAMKLELAFCPRGEPWWHDEPCTEDCEKSGIAYANGQQTDIGWDPATPYTIRIEWTDGAMSFYRNGAKLGEVGFPGFYAPQPMRVRIGTPRNDGIYPGSVFMPPGLTFKDVLIEGTPGAPTPVCGAIDPPDGGAPDGGDGGTIESPAIQDVTAASWEPGVFANVEDLNVEGAADGSPAAVVYLRFPAPAGPIAKATLVLRTHSDGPLGSAGGGSGVVCQVDDHGWDETTMTWDTRPAVGACSGAATSVDPDSDVQWDVTSLLGSGPSIDLAIVSEDTDGAHYLSKEVGGAVTGPRLLLTSSDASPTGGATGSGGASSAGSGAAANGATNGIEDDGAAAEGCGCRTPPRSAPAGAALVITAALLLGTARRRRPRRR